MTLTNDDLVEIIRLSEQEGLSSRKIASTFGCGKSTIGDFLSKKSHKEFWASHFVKPIAGGYITPSTEKKERLCGRKFMFASAQNNTYVHDKFFKSLMVYSDYNDAELIAGTFHYNKNGFQNNKNDDEWFDPKIAKYIRNEPLVIADGLVWCGELNILPTAANPLSGFQSYTGECSAIIPHAKLQMESVPTPKFDEPKHLYTTGAITQRNYIQMKAGQKAEWHHAFSALVVEIDDDGDWFVRQLNAESDTGCFYDLDVLYTPSGVVENNRIEAINYGDIHSAQVDKVVAEVSWGVNESILDTLKPKYQFVHDVHDHRARNHHSVDDPYFLFKSYMNGYESVEDEVVGTSLVIESMKRDFSEVVIVESNHDLALEKWLKTQDYRKDPVNARFFLELQLDRYNAIAESNNDFSTFENACKKVNDNLKDGVRFLRTDESFRICGDIECGQHGHNGNNGSRGSMRAFQLQSVKYNVGHSHSATIKDGVYCAGVSGELDMGYNVGGSSWSHSHIITYKNGKRAIITIKSGNIVVRC